MLQKKTRAPQLNPPAMARAALAVVFSQERDEEIAALRARIVEMQRRHEEELVEVRWLGRLEPVMLMYRNEIDDESEDTDETVVMQYLVPLIEQARWGIAPGSATSGQFNFQRPGRVDSILITYLCIALYRRYPTRISDIMANTERDARLPPGTIIRLPP